MNTVLILKRVTLLRVMSAKNAFISIAFDRAFSRRDLLCRESLELGCTDLVKATIVSKASRDVHV